MEIFLQQLINAVSLGGTYALLALGLALIFSILGLINFAHGELMTLAGYVLLLGTALGAPLMVWVPLVVLVTGLTAGLIERIAFRPYMKSGPTVMLLSSFSVSVILQILFQNLISTRPQPVPIPSFLFEPVAVMGLTIGVNQLISIVVAIGFMVSLNFFLKWTTTGISIRAAAESFDTTKLMGVSPNRVIFFTFFLSGVLAAVAGILWVAQRGSVDPLMGFSPVVKAFIATVLGGLGSLSGAVLGGFILGAGEVMLMAYLPSEMISYVDAYNLLFVVLILFIFPEGILAIKKEKSR